MRLAFERGHEWIWIMDDDSIALPDALEKLTQYCVLAAEEVSALASAVVDTGGHILGHCRRALNGKRLTDWVFELEKHSAPLERYSEAYFDIDVASFVGFLVSREAVERVGFPEKGFFIHWDDVEYSLRLRKVGRILTVPASIIVHKPPPQSAAATLRRIYYLERNRVLTCRLHGHPGAGFYTRAFLSALEQASKLPLAFAMRCSRMVANRQTRIPS